MEETEPHKSRAALWITLSVLVPLLYGLSVGPVAMVSQGKSLSPAVEKTFEIFYAPLILLHEHTPLKKPLDDYVTWWIKLAR